jgi:mannose-6-phosphate isomerase-like protein (cupin superfamily)
MQSPARAHLSTSEAMAQLPALPEEQYAVLFRHGTLTVGMYAPRGSDPQTPHEQDEVYVVVRGAGTFVHGDTRRAFAPGDLLFVPAHASHRFEDFSDDLVVWVVFYGPEGGEIDAGR